LSAEELATQGMGGAAGEDGTFHGAYSFEIAGLQSAGQSVPVVIPLKDGEGQARIPQNPHWMKHHAGAGWQAFVEDADNRLDSADGSDGQCPDPQAAGWQTGLVPGLGCVRLTIEDGGPNDVDGEANGVVRDPSALVGSASGGDAADDGDGLGGIQIKGNVGGGCTLAPHGRGIDPTLPVLFLLACLAMIRRLRGNPARR
jgi:hypothetical protein